MQDDMQHEENEQGNATSFQMKAGLGAGTFATGAFLDLAVAHGNPVGMMLAGLATYVAVKHGPELIEKARGIVPIKPVLPTREVTLLASSQKRTFVQRWLGIYPDQAEEEEPDGKPSPHYEPATAAYDLEREEPTVLMQQPRKAIQLNTSQIQDINDVVGKAIFIAGIRRSGKTTLGARIAEELGKHFIPLLLPDMEGDLLALAAVLPRALIVGHPDADTSQYPGPRFAGVTSQHAQSLGYDILDKGFQVILDLASYPTLEEGIMVQVGCIRGMIAWADAHPGLRCPSHVYLDEAQRYLPQTLGDSVIQDKAVVGELLRAYMDVIAIGGKRGIAPVILTQRFAQVNKKIMAQSEVFFLMRQTHDKDLERCMEYVKKTTATEEAISKFKQGQGVYIAADGMQQVCQFLPRRSNSARSSTPKAEAADRYADMPLTLSQRPLRPDMERAQPENMTRNATQEDRNFYAQRNDATRNGNAQQNTARPDMGRAQPAQSSATGANFKYQLAERQIIEIFALYPDIIRNKDHALAKVGANSAYRDHFNFLIQQRRDKRGHN